MEGMALVDAKLKEDEKAKMREFPNLAESRATAAQTEAIAEQRRKTYI